MGKGIKLTGNLRGYDPDHPEHLGWDLRLHADNLDKAAGYETAVAQIVRLAAHQFDGLGNASHADALRSGRRALAEDDER